MLGTFTEGFGASELFSAEPDPELSLLFDAEPSGAADPSIFSPSAAQPADLAPRTDTLASSSAAADAAFPYPPSVSVSSDGSVVDTLSTPSPSPPSSAPIYADASYSAVPPSTTTTTAAAAATTTTTAAPGTVLPEGVCFAPDFGAGPVLAASGLYTAQGSDFEEEEDDDEDDGGMSPSDVDSEDSSTNSGAEGSEHRARVPAKRQRTATPEDGNNSGGSSSSNVAPRAVSAEAMARRKRRQRKNTPPPTDPAVPAGHPLPAILGGAMPAPLRRRRRKDMTEEELRRREELGQAEEDSDSEERRLVRLPRSTLLAMSSAQIGQYIRFLRANHTLSRAQIEELRRQKRLVKNRESAKSSRKKREALVCDLQERLSHVEAQMQSLVDENARLMRENMSLRCLLKKRDLAFADSFGAGTQQLGADAQPGFNVSEYSGVDAPAVPADRRTKEGERPSSQGLRPTVRVGGLVFFFVVFAFALSAQLSVLEGRTIPDHDAQLAAPRNTWQREVIPEVSRRFARQGPLLDNGPSGKKADFLNKFGLKAEPPTAAAVGDTAPASRSEEGDTLCTDRLPSLEISESFHDTSSGVTFHRPSEWAFDRNTTYFFMSSDRRMSPLTNRRENTQPHPKPRPTFDMVVSLASIRPFCKESDLAMLSRSGEIFVDIRCTINEVSIIPEDAPLHDTVINS